MTQEQIIGNRLIAKFIDLTPCNMFPDEFQAPGMFGWMAVNVNVRAMYAKEDGEFTSFEDLFEFHSSWSWLMPVVEKIQHLEDELPVRIDFQIYLLGAVELWIDHKRVFGMTAFEPGTLINAVYGGVIEFIKWYNTQSK